MKSFLNKVATSVAVSAGMYIVLTATDSLSVPLRLAVVTALFLLSLAAAWATSKDGAGSRVAVGDKIDASGDVEVERVSVENAGETRVGTNLKSGGVARVSDVRVGRGDKDAE